MSNSLQPHGLHSPWNSLGQNTTGVGNLSLLQGIIATQELNRGLLHCRQILYQLNYIPYHMSNLQHCFFTGIKWGTFIKVTCLTWCCLYRSVIACQPLWEYDLGRDLVSSSYSLSLAAFFLFFTYYTLYAFLTGSKLPSHDILDIQMSHKGHSPIWKRSLFSTVWKYYCMHRTWKLSLIYRITPNELHFKRALLDTSEDK